MKLDDGQHDQPLKQVGFISSECAKPSEINLTHCGGFFLEELSEFGAWMLDMPRQPLEHEIVSISRSAGLLIYPANVIAIASIYPCPCGFYSDPRKRMHLLYGNGQNAIKRKYPVR